MQYHKVTVDVNGPFSSEVATSSSNTPFLRYRYDVSFTQGDESITVPGFFAADGNAAHTLASSGTVWRAYFRPPNAGVWSVTVSFVYGSTAAISDPSISTPYSSIHGMSGTFCVEPTNKSGRDLRSKGTVRYVGTRYIVIVCCRLRCIGLKYY